MKVPSTTLVFYGLYNTVVAKDDYNILFRVPLLDESIVLNILNNLSCFKSPKINKVFLSLQKIALYESQESYRPY